MLYYVEDVCSIYYLWWDIFVNVVRGRNSGKGIFRNKMLNKR